MDVVDALASEFGAGVGSEGVVLQVGRATLKLLGLFAEVLPLWTFALSRRIQPPFWVLANSHWRAGGYAGAINLPPQA